MILRQVKKKPKRLTEKKIWNKLNLFQKQNDYAHFMRIESSTINGIPDVYCAYEGYNFWLELKANQAKNSGLSKYQTVWHLKHKRAGGICFIMNWPLLHEPPKILEVREPGIVVPVPVVPVPVLTISNWIYLDGQQPATGPAGNGSSRSRSPQKTGVF